MTGRKKAAALATLGLSSLAVALAPAAPAAAATCYGGQTSVTYTAGTAKQSFGPFTASNRCNDVNVRVPSDNVVFACVVFVDHTEKCNRNDTFQGVGKDWVAVATDVRNGTRFKVRLVDATASPLKVSIAY
ncbi:hypothetical protein [Couchioplanes caeruleus]|uniref:Secreted protein n=2 Tax=Couchioplanes caeruleus TaxID=56438 RepID=A0A1K0FQK3_9ACTN|nr:hypothetical protein [Couchioplanes caeruleus]OJF15065.1 hypothetical protein BG844_06315 [Couchioplanes caeruleus subsp. caeruleus]ROP33932.1 hypothetical protein EDD30_6992 [Couchioplanes caeruleus]